MKKKSKQKEMCWCGEEHENMAELMTSMDKLMRKHTVEFKKPRKNGQIGHMLGVPIFIKK